MLRFTDLFGEFFAVRHFCQHVAPEIFHPEQKIPVAGHGLAVVFKEGVMELADPRQDVPFDSLESVTAHLLQKS